jgi:hypothetical protein
LRRVVVVDEETELEVAVAQIVAVVVHQDFSEVNVEPAPLGLELLDRIDVILALDHQVQLRVRRQRLDDHLVRGLHSRQNRNRRGDELVFLEIEAAGRVHLRLAEADRDGGEHGIRGFESHVRERAGRRDHDVAESWKTELDLRGHWGLLLLLLRISSPGDQAHTAFTISRREGRAPQRRRS